MSIINTTKDLIDLAKKGAAVELEIRLVRMQEAELELREEIVKLKTELARILSDLPRVTGYKISVQRKTSRREAKWPFNLSR